MIISRLLLLALCLWAGGWLPLLAQPGRDGERTLAGRATVLNEFTHLTADAAAGATHLTVANAALQENRRFAQPLQSGDLLLIVQMQGALADDTGQGGLRELRHAGQWEWAEVTSVGLNRIDLRQPLTYAYVAADRAQVVRVPRFSRLRLGADALLTTEPWNGQTGGVLAVEVLETLTLDPRARIGADGLGLRGGAGSEGERVEPAARHGTAPRLGGAKGESVVPSSRYGYGAAANGGGGGNAQGAGGGGGANGGHPTAWTGLGNPPLGDVAWRTAWDREFYFYSETTSSGGGRGGYSTFDETLPPDRVPPGDARWGGDRRRTIGGLGGQPLNYDAGRLFVGAGGGGPAQPNGRGGAGGGLIFLVAQRLVGPDGELATLSADGQAGTLGGGGGSGGTIVLQVRDELRALRISAVGGSGGHTSATRLGGPGGGGGGGYVALAGQPRDLQLSVAGGSGGQAAAALAAAFPPNGATDGGLGTVAYRPYPTPSALLPPPTTAAAASSPAPAPLVPTDPLDTLRTGTDLVLENLFFGTNTSELLPDSERELNRLYQFMVRHPQARIELGGHTDNTASRQYAQRLSQARAQAVADHLRAQGIESERLAVVGYGATRPAHSNTTEEGRRRNRRVTVRVLAR